MSYIGKNVAPQQQGTYSQSEIDTQMLTKVPKVTSTDNAIVRFDGTTGQVQNSGVIIDDSGNVGIGVTPSAWGSGRTSIESGNVLYTTANISSQIRTNAYMDGSNDIRKISNWSTNYIQADGTHKWQLGGDGTAGNPIAWNTAMTLGSNGNLLVGTTTDNGVDKLQVNGSMSDVDISRKLSVGFSTTIGTGQTYIANLQDLVQSNGLSSGIYLVRVSMNGNGNPYWSSEHTFVTFIPVGGASTYNSSPANVMQSNSWYHHRTSSEHIFYTDSNGNEGAYGQLSLYCSAGASYPDVGVVRIKRLLND